jgi:hypothetical protein
MIFWFASLVNGKNAHSKWVDEWMVYVLKKRMQRDQYPITKYEGVKS